MKRIILLVVLTVLAGCHAQGSPRSSSQTAVDLKPVYFEVNSASITDPNLIGSHAQWLKAHKNNVIILEGHTDQRGGEQFNLHLGDRRARAVMAALMEQGIPENQLIVVSYGKKRPVISGRGERSWSKNRRVEFKLRQ